MAEETKETTTTTTPPPQTTEVKEAVTEATPPKKKKAKRAVPQGEVHILASFNNTIVTITDTKGAVLASASAGSCGFRGSKKGTAFAAQVAAEKALTGARQMFGLTKVAVYVSGIGLGREAALRTLGSSNLQLDGLVDVTGTPHGGVRPRKARRV